MDIDYKIEKNFTHVHVSGELNFSTVNEFEEKISSLFRLLSTKDELLLMIVNFEDLVFIDSSGISAIVKLFLESRRRLIEIGYCSFRPLVKKSLYKVHVEEILQIYEDEETAKKIMSFFERLWPRFHYRKEALLMLENENLEIEIVNISLKGCCFISPKHFEGDVKMRIWIDDNQMNALISPRWQEVWSRGFGVGCVFISHDDKFELFIHRLIEELNQDLNRNH